MITCTRNSIGIGTKSVEADADVRPGATGYHAEPSRSARPAAMRSFASWASSRPSAKDRDPTRSMRPAPFPFTAQRGGDSVVRSCDVETMLCWVAASAAIATKSVVHRRSVRLGCYTTVRPSIVGARMVPIRTVSAAALEGEMAPLRAGSDQPPGQSGEAASMSSTGREMTRSTDRSRVGAGAGGLGDEQAVAGALVAGDVHRDQEVAGVVGLHGGALAGAVGPQQRDGRVGREPEPPTPISSPANTSLAAAWMVGV